MRKLLPRVLVSGLLLAGLAWHLDGPALARLLVRADPGLCLAACTVYLGAQAVSAARWRLLTGPLGFHDGYCRFLSLYFVGMCFNLLLPTSVGGDVVKAWRLGGPGRRTAAALSVAADRAGGLAVLIWLAALAACISPVPLPPGVGLLLGCLAVAAVGFPVASAVLTPWLATQPYAWLPATLRRPALNLTRLVADAAVAYRGRLPRVAMALGLSVIVQSANVVVAALLSAALGLSVPLAYLAVAVPLVTLLTLLPVSVSGVGVREAGMSLVLAAASVPATEAVGLSLLSFGVAIVGGLIGAGLVAIEAGAKASDERVKPEQDDGVVGRAA